VKTVNTNLANTMI